MKSIIDQANTKNDQSLKYTEEANYTKICIGLSLRLLAAFYAWPGFEDMPNTKLLQGI